MNIYLEKVKEFMLTFGQPVLDKPTVLSDDRQELRIALIFEELKEYSYASGKADYFNDLCNKSYSEFVETGEILGYVPVVDQVEQLDALEDLQYVLSGAVHEHGFGEIFDTGFDEVHDSNMSKADETEVDADITRNKYDDHNIETHTIYNSKTGVYVNYRTEDGKVLKSHKYKPAQLAQFLQ